MKENFEINPLFKDYHFDEAKGCWISAHARFGFDYSDGEEVERRIYDAVCSTDELGYASIDLGRHITDWPTRYHFSPLRGNLLRPFEALFRGHVLEVGAGCGAITRFLGECGGEIVALEGSLLRGTTAAARCRNLPNVQVIVDAFDKLPRQPVFDVVTLVGVLEYARKYFPSQAGDPVDDLISHAKGFLKPGGILVVAIENQLGLKYFAGAGEDHVGVPMFGIEDRYDRDGVVTFGRKELRDRLVKSGLTEQQWWLPFPDYKLPTALVSEQAFNSAQESQIAPLLAPTLERDLLLPHNPHFMLARAWGAVSRNGLGGELANSFLVFASDQPIPEHSNGFAYHFASERRPEYAKVVRFVTGYSGVEVQRQLMFPGCSRQDDRPIRMQLAATEPLIIGTLWSQRLRDILSFDGWSFEDLADWAEQWYSALLKRIPPNHDNEPPCSSWLVPGGLLDATPRNMLLRADGQVDFFDLEWHLELPLELGFLVFRGIYLAFLDIAQVGSPRSDTSTRVLDIFTTISNRLGLRFSPKDIARYCEIESDIQFWVSARSPLGVDDILACTLKVRHTHDLSISVETLRFQLSEMVAQRDATIKEIQSQLDTMTRWGQSTAKAVEERDALIKELQRQVEDVSIWGQSSAIGIEERDALIKELRRQVEDVSIWGQSNVLAIEERDALIKELHRQVEEMTNSEQSNLKAAEERDGLIKNLSTQLEATQAANVKMVSERDLTIAGLSEQITSLGQELSARQQALEAKQAELMKMSDWAFGMMQDLKRVKTPLHVKVADRARGAKQILRRQLANTVLGDLVRHVRDSRRYRANMVSFDAVARSLQENNGRLIVTFPIITWDFRWQRPQHIVSRLRDQGYSVLYLAMSMSPLQRKFRSSREAGAALQFNNLGPHVNQIWLHSKQPVNIYTDPLAGDDLYNVVSGLQALLTSLKPKSVHYLIQFPGWWPVAEALRQSHGGSVVFDCMDDHGGFSTNTAQALKTEHDLIERANLVITSSALLEDRCKVLNQNTIQVKNGTEYNHFHDPKPNGELDHLQGQPVIGYYGAISDWFDMNIVAHCARARPQWHFVLIGATFGADLSPVEGLPNVHFLGEKPYASLPGYLAYFDVCTIPFKLIPLTLATNPVKFYEYLSAGKPVVSIDLPELMPYADDCYLARNASEFLDQIDLALIEKSDSAKISRRLELAQANSWDSRAQAILAHPVLSGRKH